MRKRWRYVLLFVIVVVTIGVDILLWGRLSPYDRLLALGISVYIISLCCAIIFFSGDGIIALKESLTDKVSESEIENAFYFVKAWKMSNFLWLSVYWLLTAASLLLSIFVIYIASNEPDELAKVIQYAIASIALTTISSIIRPKEQAYGYRMAFEHLNRRILYFSCNMCEWQDVIRAIDEGERIITGTSYDTVVFDVLSSEPQNRVNGSEIRKEGETER